MNLARIKCLSQLVCAMCKVQMVNFSKLASAFDNRTPKESSFRRIQRFMAQTVLNLDIVAKVVMKLLPEKGLNLEQLCDLSEDADFRIEKSEEISFDQTSFQAKIHRHIIN